MLHMFDKVGVQVQFHQVRKSVEYFLRYSLQFVVVKVKLTQFWKIEEHL